MTLGQQGAYTGSQWVGGGKLDAGAVTISASTIFPNAAKGLQLALITDLDMFDFPSSGCNFSMYREVPYQVPVVAYMGKDMITWERATELGARDFCMRVVVLPVSTREVLVQVGVTPLSLDELKESYGEVFEQPYFPNTMVKVSKSQNKLPSFMGNKTSSLVKPVELVLEDQEGMGMGVLPFTTTASSATGDSYTEVERPPRGRHQGGPLQPYARRLQACGAHGGQDARGVGRGPAGGQGGGECLAPSLVSLAHCSGRRC